MKQKQDLENYEKENNKERVTFASVVNGKGRYESLSIDFILQLPERVKIIKI